MLLLFFEEVAMRAFTVLLCAIFVLNSLCLRKIQHEPKESYACAERVGCILPEDRQIVFDKYREVRAVEWKNVNISKNAIVYDFFENIGASVEIQCRPIVDSMIEKYSDFISVWHARNWFFNLCGYLGSDRPDEFEEYVAKCMSIPYVRESQTGLAVEALIKRLENALHDQEKPKIKKWSHKNISATKPFDFSILDAFQPDDLGNVALMNREWRDHHEDPEYDHGAAKYWFADLDSDLETEIQRVEPILQKIASQWFPTANRQRARNILYDWREYFSENYEEYAYTL